jgi:hypothetical protein
MSCIICYDDELLINCINCNTSICESCLIRQLEITNKAIKIPKCSHCNFKFYYSFISLTDSSELMKLYIDTVHKYLLKKFENNFNEIEIKKKLVEQIINKRKQHFDRFPNGIKIIVQTALMHKIKKVDKTNAETIKTVVNTSTKNCLNPVCMGKLKINQCLLCDVTFCLNCEKPKQSNHKCNKADLDSLQLIRSESVKCPNCSVPISKSEGCNEMSCTVCNHNFNYRDPTLVSHGNPHNMTFNYKGVRTLNDIRAMFNDEHRELITNIINMKLGQFELFPIVQNRTKTTIVKAYENKFNHKKFMIEYNKIVVKIHQKYDKKKLSVELLQYYNDELNHCKKLFNIQK